MSSQKHDGFFEDEKRLVPRVLLYAFILKPFEETKRTLEEQH